MLGDLKPLVPYLKRYRRGFFWGGVSVVLSNAIWILFPQVLRIAHRRPEKWRDAAEDPALCGTPGAGLAGQGRLPFPDAMDHHRDLARH